MSPNRDIIMSPIPRKLKATRQLSIDPQKDYSTPLQVETSVEYDLPQHIYPPKGAKPILMVHPAYTRTPATNNSTLSSINERNYDLPYIISDLRKRSVSKVSCKKHKCDFDICCNNSARKVSRSANNNIKSKMPLSDCLTNTPVDVSFSPVCKAPFKYTVYNNAIENQVVLEDTDLQLRLHQHPSQLNMQTQNNISNEVLWNPVSQHDSFSSMITQKCQFGCCKTVMPNHSGFLAPGVPPSLVNRTPSRIIAGGSPKVRARSRRTANAVNSVPDYLSAARPLRSLTTGPNIPSSLNHQRSRSNIALYSSAQTQQLSSSLTPQTLINQMPLSLSQTITSSTVGPCRDSGCSIGTDSSLGNVNSNINYGKKLDRISVGADSGFNTPGNSPFDVHMESNDINNNSSVFYSRNTPIANKYCAMMAPSYAHHLLNLQNSLVPSAIVPRYQVNSPLLQPYYHIPETLLNLAY